MININDFVIEDGVLKKYTGTDTDVTVPDFVTCIGDNCFQLSYKLKSVTIGDSVKSIGNNAFRRCTVLTSVSIGNSVTRIGKEAFSRCTNLSSVTIGNSVTNIGEMAFSDCALLRSIIIPNSLKRIGRYSFSGCTALESITIPSSVTNIGINAFYDCPSLTSITVDENNLNYCSIDGHLYDKNVETLIRFAQCKGDATFIVPKTVKSIGEMAFSDCDSLTDITIPDSVTSIGERAFSGCCSLTSITIGNSLEHVGENAFWASNSLKKMFIGVRKLSDEILKKFSDISSIAVLVAPKMSFDDLKRNGLALPAANGYLLNSEMFENHPEKDDYKKYISTQKKKILPEIFKEDLEECLNVYAENGIITKKNFEEDFFNRAQVANATKCIAFLMDWKNRNISQKDIDKQLENELIKDPFNVTDMKKLWSYEKLEDGTLAILGYNGDETVVSIPERIGKSAVAVIAKDAFSVWKSGRRWESCKKLKEIREIIISASLTTIGESAFSGCGSLTSITIPNSVTSISERAFSECTSLVSVLVSASVTQIGGCAFSKCTSLASIEVDEDNMHYKSIDGILYSKDLKTIIRYPAGKKGADFVVPDSVTTISKGAFSDCTSLTSITIPNSVTCIGEWAFSGCGSLISITILNSVTTISKGAFSDCTSLTSITIPNSVTSISERAFSGCGSLTSITIPNSVTTISEGAFSDCTSLTSITIPNSVTSISERAFSECTSLVSITIPNSVTSIGERAFSGCDSLADITIPDSVTSIADSAFASCGLMNVYYLGNEKKWEKISYYVDELYYAEVHFGK